MEESNVCNLLVDLAVKRGHKDVARKPGIFEMKIDDTWTAKCNPHDDTIDLIPTYSWAIEFNGWPAGIVHIVHGGLLCDGNRR